MRAKMDARCPRNEQASWKGMIATHEVDVQPRNNKNIAFAEHVRAPHDAIQALEFCYAVDLGGLKHGLSAAEDAGHVWEQVF
jgi:hypothetical protein